MPVPVRLFHCPRWVAVWCTSLRVIASRLAQKFARFQVSYDHDEFIISRGGFVVKSDLVLSLQARKFSPFYVSLLDFGRR
jgi:hypothetical protein